MSETQPELPNRQPSFSEAFKAFIATGWGQDSGELPAELPAAAPAAQRRIAVSALFPGERLIIPAGGLKVRSNDTDYRFRPHSAFAHLTGLGTDREPDAVLVLEPVGPAGSTDPANGSRHDATLYFTPPAARDSAEFYSDPRTGEMWVGRRLSLAEMSALCGIRCLPLTELDEQLTADAEAMPTRILRQPDPELTAHLDRLRAASAEELKTQDARLAEALSELRLIKDEFEIDQLRQACAETATAFREVVANLPEAVKRGRGERWVEGVFGLHARHAGNAVGYDTIAASGAHACTLHWIRNDGDLNPEDLLLLDAGIELDTLYTADITRTLPVGGQFSADQRLVYEAVLAAQQAGIDAARPGAKFSDVHVAAITVLAKHLEVWGMLPVSAEESLAPTGGQHRRWMVHGTSHHLGIDVHDCAQARRENYRDGVLAPGMVITVEPGLYFRPDDEYVPANLRGIGIRIEDDILITSGAAEILSGALPRDSYAVEAWMAASEAV